MSQNNIKKSFEYWKNEIADMPSVQDGKWVDLETGLTYADYFEAVTKKELAQKREHAKKIGLKALKGSQKQKEWAEKIRKEILSAMDNETAKMFTGETFHSSKFWIDNREKNANQFKKFIVELCKLKDEYAKTKSDDVKQKHQALIKDWVK
jgi:hypothetical protein